MGSPQKRRLRPTWCLLDHQLTTKASRFLLPLLGSESREKATLRACTALRASCHPVWKRFYERRHLEIPDRGDRSEQSTLFEPEEEQVRHRVPVRQVNFIDLTEEETP